MHGAPAPPHDHEESADATPILPVLSGLIVLLALLAGTAYWALAGGEAAAPETAEARPTSVVLPPVISTQAARLPLPFTVYIMCDEEVADSPPAGTNFTVLRAFIDRNLIIDLLQGRPTRLPASVRIVQSECFREALASGEFV
jgi:hypothetical protein